MGITVGVPVDDQNNTFDYPILTSVTLTCMATAADGTPATATSYSWINLDCDSCFYNNHDGTQNIIGNNLQAKDTGGVVCTATINGRILVSTIILRLRISGRLAIENISLYNM